MKKMMITGFLGIFCTTMLTACAIESTRNSTSIKQIREVKLADGSVTRVGFTPIAAEWNCTQLYKKSNMIAENTLKSAVSWGGPMRVLEQEAIKYANEAHLKTNYIFLYSPNETRINGFNLSAFKEASATYYQCKQPPALTNKIF